MNRPQRIRREHKPKVTHRVRRLVLILVILWVVLWGATSLLAPSVIRGIAPSLISRAKQLGIDITELSFSSARISPWLNGIGLRNPRTRFDLNPKDEVNLRSEIRMNSVEVRIQDLFQMRGSVRADGILVRFDPADLPPSVPFDRFDNGKVFIANLPLLKPKSAIQEILDGLEELFVENELVGDFEFSGDVKLVVQDAQVAAHMYTEREGKRFRLRFRDSDVRELAKKMQVDLAEEQLEIISLYPLRVPVLILITDRARDLSEKHEPKDAWLRDAHRHVTWSYLLAKHFGESFAKEVTDAQEMKPGNSPDERTMDFHNNAMGRKLFAEGSDIEDLPELVRVHPNIIRHPDEVKSFAGQLLR